MNNERRSINSILLFAGTLISYVIGSGFSTAQELVQFFTAHGWFFLLGILLSIGIFYFGISDYIRTGGSGELQHGNEIFPHICGKFLGTVYNIIAIIYCYLALIVMCGGASTILQQQFGAPAHLGAILLGIGVICIVITGIKGIVSVMSKLGPLIIGLILLIAIITIFRHADQIIPGIHMVQNGAVVLPKAGANVFQAALPYAGGALIGSAIFMTELGLQNNIRHVLPGVRLGVVFVIFTMILMNLALFSSVTAIADANAPSIVLAGNISPVLATVFSFIVYIGTCNASIPLLWTAASRFAKEKTSAFRIMVVVLGVLAVTISCLFSYPTLVNFVYGTCGYMGMLILLLLIIRRLRPKHRQQTEQAV